MVRFVIALLVAWVSIAAANAATETSTREITILDTRTSTDTRNDFRWVAGIKAPNSPEEGTDSRQVFVRAPHLQALLAPSAETTLLPFVLRAPDQTEAGSCLYMSLTGAAEIWLAKLNPRTSRKSDGPLDLSERWLMNSAGDGTYTRGIQQWRVDSVYLFNNLKEMPTNAAYRFTKGWYTVDSKGSYDRADASTPGALYDTPYNWFDDRAEAGPARVKLPTFSREVLFEDPARDSWNVGVAPTTLVEDIKKALRTHKAPVQVLYNHYGYWHAHLIVGYDDTKSTDGCGFVEGSRRFYNGERMRDDGNPPTQAELDRMAERKKKYVATAQKLNASLAKRQACNAKGVFYVRDSIFVDEKQPDYVYDPSSGTKGVGKYSVPIVEFEYSYITHIANHALVIKAK